MSVNHAVRGEAGVKGDEGLAVRADVDRTAFLGQSPKDEGIAVGLGSVEKFDIREKGSHCLEVANQCRTGVGDEWSCMLRRHPSGVVESDDRLSNAIIGGDRTGRFEDCSHGTQAFPYPGVSLGQKADLGESKVQVGKSSAKTDLNQSCQQHIDATPTQKSEPGSCRQQGGVSMAKSAVAASGFHGSFPGVEEGGEMSSINAVAAFPEFGEPQTGAERLEGEELAGAELTGEGDGFEQSAHRKNRPGRQPADVFRQQGRTELRNKANLGVNVNHIGT
jgi:hypothetical protein